MVGNVGVLLQQTERNTIKSVSCGKTSKFSFVSFKYDLDYLKTNQFGLIEDWMFCLVFILAVKNIRNNQAYRFKQIRRGSPVGNNLFVTTLYVRQTDFKGSTAAAIRCS